METYEAVRARYPELRVRAARYVAWNWGVRQRLPRLTALAYDLGFIDPNIDPGLGCPATDFREVRPRTGDAERYEALREALYTKREELIAEGRKHATGTVDPARAALLNREVRALEREIAPLFRKIYRLGHRR